MSKLGTQSKRLLAIGLLLVFVGVLAASINQTEGGKVQIKQLTIVSDEGNQLHASMYLPNGVDKEHQAPCVMVVHGGNSSRFAVANIAQEFARRGYVAVIPDQSNNGQSDRGTNNFSGTEDVMKYITTLDFVDQTKLCVMGHSAGGVVTTMAEANPQFGIKAGISLGVGNNVKPETPINNACIHGATDENSGPRGADSDLRGPIDYHKSKALCKFMGVPEGTELVSGTETGSLENNTLRTYLRPNCGHTGLRYSPEAIGMILRWTDRVLEHKSSIAPENQTWLIRECATAFAYIGLMIALVGALGLQTKKSGLNSYADAPAQGHAKTNVAYWMILALLCAIPAVLIQSLYTIGKKVFLAISRNVFAMEHISGVIFWMIVTALIILLISLLCKKLDKQYDWSFDKSVLVISRRELVQYLKMAVFASLMVYLLVYLAEFFGDVCIRLVNAEVTTFTRTRFGVFWAYLPLYVLYYAFIGYVQVTGLLCEKQPVWSQYVRTALASSASAAIMLILWYGIVGFTGINALFSWRIVLGVLLNFLPGMVVGAVVQVFTYRHTGKIWLGVFTNAILFAWMATSSGVMLPV